VRERFSASGRRLGRQIEVEAGEPLYMRGDAGRLEQAVGNLVDNALRHGAGPIALRARQVDGAVELHVEDGGGGFPAEFLPHAFERFTRADRARARGGTGLGLAIVEAIARAHGGGARAANGTRGADVSLSIPAG
jgi:signal transduction histidine kinase